MSESKTLSPETIKEILKACEEAKALGTKLYNRLEEREAELSALKQQIAAGELIQIDVCLEWSLAFSKAILSGGAYPKLQQFAASRQKAGGEC